MLKILFSKSLIKTFIILAIFLLPFFALWLYVLAPLALDAATSPDAIAFRVMPNPDHLSPRRWYQDNIKLKGSPQGLTVDGYEAVRDGRTVYVNAANIDLKNRYCSKDQSISCSISDTQCVLADGACVPKFYTNIYIISYNQAAENETVDIFAQILAHWKFNTNISEPEDNSETVAQSCLYSSDCPTGEYCLSKKANIIRDTKRLADLNDIKEALEKYNSQHGFYPKLAAGSYLANKTISTWPSWQASLGKELGLVLPVDPINRLGACSGYDATTCWNQTLKKFYDPSPGNGVFNLPADSHVFFYETNANGSSYSACSVMQSGLLTPQNSSSACADSAKSTSISISGQNPNHLPIITCGTLTGYPRDEFLGYVSASDPDGDSLQWSLDTSVADWSSWTDGRPVLANSASDLTLKKLWAKKAGARGKYNLTVKVKDRAADWTTKICSIEIREGLAFVSPIPAQTVHIGDNLNYVIDVYVPNEQYPLSYVITQTDGSNLILTCTLQPDKHSCLIDQTLTTIGTFDYKVKVTDNKGTSIETPVTLTVFNENPILTGAETVNFSASSTNNFSYSLEATDANLDYPLTSELTGALPRNWARTFVRIGDLFRFTIAGLFSPLPDNSIIGSRDFNFVIKITDHFGAWAQKTLKIIVTNNPPSLDLTNCQTRIEVGLPYACQPITADPEGNLVTYVFSGLPAGLSGNAATGAISGAPTAAANSTITVTATDEYGASATRSYSLDVVIVCGDGVKQVSEECDQTITDSKTICENLSSHGLKDLDNSSLDCNNLAGNLRSESDLKFLYAEICQKCSIRCLGDAFFSKIGSGCYIDENNNNKIDINECNKGLYKCEDAGAGNFKIKCAEQPGWAGVAKDYCCLNKKVDLATQSVDIVDITLKGDGSIINPYVYRTCDELCRDWGKQQGYVKNSICVGVGFNNGAGVHDECVGSVHDLGGGNCQLADNQTAINCKSLIFYDSWGSTYGDTGYYTNASAGKYAGNKYNTYEECEADSVKPEYHDVGFKPEMGGYTDMYDFTHNVGLLYTKRPCIFLPANTSLPALVMQSYTTISDPRDLWWRAYFNKTASGNNFCLEGGKDYNKYTTSCYCEQMP